MLTLPRPDASGVVLFRDGSKIAPRARIGRFVASWAPKPGAPNGAMLRGAVDEYDDDDGVSYFHTAEDAAAALAAGGGEGPEA